MPAIIYCNNRLCMNNERLEEPISFLFTKYYKPLGKNVFGRCIRYPRLECMTFGKNDIIYREAVCHTNDLSSLSLSCLNNNCIYNEKEKCVRNEIFIDKELDYYVCRCYSQFSISGHIDFFQNLNPDGTAKGEHIDDNYAMKLGNEDKKFKSYKIGHHEEKEKK